MMNCSCPTLPSLALLQTHEAHLGSYKTCNRDKRETVSYCFGIIYMTRDTFSILRVATNQSADRLMAHAAAPSAGRANAPWTIWVSANVHNVYISVCFQAGCDVTGTPLWESRDSLSSLPVISSAPICHILTLTNTKHDRLHGIWWSACGETWNLS